MEGLKSLYDIKLCVFNKMGILPVSPVGEIRPLLHFFVFTDIKISAFSGSTFSRIAALAFLHVCRLPFSEIPIFTFSMQRQSAINSIRRFLGSREASLPPEPLPPAPNFLQFGKRPVAGFGPKFQEIPKSLLPPSGFLGTKK